MGLCYTFNGNSSKPLKASRTGKVSTWYVISTGKYTCHNVKGELLPRYKQSYLNCCYKALLQISSKFIANDVQKIRFASFDICAHGGGEFTRCGLGFGVRWGLGITPTPSHSPSRADRYHFNKLE